jgi:hypothetical protein
MNKQTEPAKVTIAQIWQDLVSSLPASEPKPLTRQRKRAIAYTISLRAVNLEYQNENGTFTLSRKGRHRIARAASQTALRKGRLHKVLKKKEDS